MPDQAWKWSILLSLSLSLCLSLFKALPDQDMAMEYMDSMIVSLFTAFCKMLASPPIKLTASTVHEPSLHYVKWVRIIRK
jgi:hypothetical protein